MLKMDLCNEIKNVYNIAIQINETLIK